MNIKVKMDPKFSLKTLILVGLSATIGIFACHSTVSSDAAATNPAKEANKASADTTVFTPPDTSTIPHNEFGDMVRYGRDLIVRTAYYIGPNGTVGKYLGNKMNCTNCHLDAGTRPFAFNFYSSYARYPQYRGRENEVLDIGQRINNCVERPHSGRPLPLGGKEILAMECYIRWVGSNVPIGHHVRGDENLELELPDRAADPQKGAIIYAKNCASCHGNNGEGKMTPDLATYVYPPLWGSQSFQKGSSPSRVLKAAGFIKANMPDKIATWRKPLLTDEQCIDVAAFLNDDQLNPRPLKKDRSIPDYPNPKTKAIDYDMGPFPDTFSEKQHKFGPFKPIKEYYEAHGLTVTY